ncbi:MAG: TAXI family TRAP transporter solute-binding subunit [Burkholderiales bacterium]
MVQLVARRLILAFALLAALALAACAPQPDAEIVRKAVQQQLDTAFGARVLQIEKFKRAGSQSLAGRDGRLVYYDAELKLLSDYNFGDWDKHNVGTLANLLGAGPKGIFGLGADGNRQGDSLGVYGSAAFLREGTNSWRLVPTAPPQEVVATLPPAAAGAAVRPRPKEAPPPTEAELALEELRALLHSPTGPTMSTAERDAIVTEAAQAAVRQARTSLARTADTIVLAAGPPSGAYEEVARALAARAKAASVSFELSDGSEGSVGNIRLLADGAVQFALVQNDIALAAFEGRGRFGGAAQADLRAVASLFPEAVQLVVRADGPIKRVADLAGRRVDLGLESSGTRANALAILAAHDIKLESLQAVTGGTLSQAAGMLVEGKIDALFTTVHAPARVLQQVAAKSRLAFVDILPTDALRASGLVPLKLPARTYAGQIEPVQTLATTALLVTRGDVPASQVDAMLKLVFEPVSTPRGEGAAMAQIGTGTAREGVTIPFMPAAQAYLERHTRR